MLRKTRGFRLGHRLVTKVFKFFSSHRRRKCRAAGYKRLNQQASSSSRAMSKLCNLGRLLNRFRRRSGYILAGEEPVQEAPPVSVPKGHLAVYVGDKEDDTCRVLVPVIYFNHPLFADLLKETEKVYGFNHQGGIQIPCQKSQFDSVKTRIAAASSGSRCHGRWRWIKS